MTEFKTTKKVKLLGKRNQETKNGKMITLYNFGDSEAFQQFELLPSKDVTIDDNMIGKDVIITVGFVRQGFNNNLYLLNVTQ